MSRPARFQKTGPGMSLSGVGMSVHGAQELRALLEGLQKNVAKKILRTALREGAKIVQAAAKDRAPVKTGRLKRSIVVRASKRKKRPGEVAFVVFPDPKKFGDHPSDQYAGVVEYGSADTEARPYLRPAFDATKDQVVATVQRKVMEGVLAARTGKSK